ncbi:hypothetical protein D3C72_2309410 [compost metagenome]
MATATTATTAITAITATMAIIPAMRPQAATGFRAPPTAGAMPTALAATGAASRAAAACPPTICN